MTTFSVAPQTVLDPKSGLSLTFKADPADTSKVQCSVTMKDANDYLSLVFNRNGLLLNSKMVDWEAEEDARLRAEALVRQGAYVDPEAKKVEDETAKKAAADQAAKDKALLASTPKVSKYDDPAPESAPVWPDGMRARNPDGSWVQPGQPGYIPPPANPAQGATPPYPLGTAPRSKSEVPA